MKICFLTKIEKAGVEKAIAFTEKISSDIEIFTGDISDPFPQDIQVNSYDMLISYISPWIVPNEILLKTKLWNINFHPGPPEYPGIGCFNFAIYESAKEFGVTAHIMNPKVDTGAIIGVKRFVMAIDETVLTLSVKTYQALLELYKEIIEAIDENNSLPVCDETWKRKPYKRSDLEKLAIIMPDMSKSEINEKIRATYYAGNPGPFIELHGHRFEYNPDR